MKTTKKLPVGIEDFGKIRTEGFYYVDKTDMIKELLDNWGEVNLFTRPRRFGKSLNMSMLRYFFGNDCERALFDGLKIAGEKELCEKYMGKFPVISISLKDAGADCYEMARSLLCTVIGREAVRFHFILEGDMISKEEKARYGNLIRAGKAGEPNFPMADGVLIDSLRLLCELLFQYYGKPVILLIDEYDVPLDKAQQYGYYDEMVNLIRALFGQALKTNPCLYFAVLTGCLRIAKESIFTGLNNLRVFSVADTEYGEHFGFLEKEVAEMLNYYGAGQKYELVRTWYDGYCFGNTDVYCPWDVIQYCAKLRSDPDASPQAFWMNTSGNEILRALLKKATIQTKRELEQIVAGGSVRKKICQELTYRDLYKSIENMWSVLFMTGYLTKRGMAEGDLFELVIPNHEIRQIFVEQIMEWFQEEAGKDASRLDAFCTAFLQADAAAVEEGLNAYLAKTISIRDTSVKGKKENFYHGILLGLLGHREDWWVSSNAESGDGYSDILVEYEEKGIGMVIEVKYPEDGDLEKGCKAALEQIEKMGYETKLKQDGMGQIIRYGIACSRKKCKVAVGQLC